MTDRAVTEVRPHRLEVRVVATLHNQAGELIREQQAAEMTLFPMDFGHLSQLLSAHWPQVEARLLNTELEDR